MQPSYFSCSDKGKTKGTKKKTKTKSRSVIPPHGYLLRAKLSTVHVYLMVCSDKVKKSEATEGAQEAASPEDVGRGLSHSPDERQSKKSEAKSTERYAVLTKCRRFWTKSGIHSLSLDNTGIHTFCLNLD